MPEFSAVLTVHHSFKGSDPRTRPGHVWQGERIGAQEVPKRAKTICAWFKGESGAARDEGFDRPPRGCIRCVEHLGPDDVYIGRGHKDKRGRALAGSKWANPFKLNDCTDLEECISRFDAHLRSSAKVRKIYETCGVYMGYGLSPRTWVPSSMSTMRRSSS